MEDGLTEITSYLLRQSWQVAAVFVIAGAACLALRKASAHWRYLLWLVVLAKCLVPPLVILPLAVLPAAVPTEAEPAPMPAAAPLAFEALPPPASEPPAGAPVFEPAEAQPHPPAASLPPVEPTAARALPRLSPRQWLALGWAAGAALFAAIALLKAARTHRRLGRRRRPAPAALRKEVAELAGRMGLGAAVKVWLVNGVGQPFVWGLLRGDIYLPGEFEKTASAGNRRGILAHELAHVARCDAAVNAFQIVVQGFFFFHPLVWWANRKIRREREKCCDEAAIASLDSSPKQYGSAIVQALVAEHEATQPVPSLAVAGPARNVEDRIKTILSRRRRFHRRPTWLAIVTALLLAALAVPTALVLTARAEPKVDKPATTRPGASQAQPGEKTVAKHRPVWITLLPLSPVRSFEKYHHTYQARSLVAEGARIRSCEIELRQAEDNKRIARARAGVFDDYITQGKLFKGSRGSSRIQLPWEWRKGDLKSIKAGGFLLAMYVNGVRCSNVAGFTINPDYDPKEAPTLALEPIEPQPGQALPDLAIRAVGPTPADPKFRCSSVAFCSLVVDGVQRRPKAMKWAGGDWPLKPGERYMAILRLDNYAPAIKPAPQHRLVAKVGKYSSAPLIVSAARPLGLAWDKATAAGPGRTVSLRGRVTGPDGKPAAHYDVGLSEKGGRGIAERTDDKGSYRFLDVPAGTYSLICHPRGRGQPILTITGLVLEANQALARDLSLQRGFRISGHVTHPDGTPARNVDVMSTWPSPDGAGEFHDSARTDAQGRYTIGAPFPKASYVGIGTAGPTAKPKRDVEAGRSDVDFVVPKPAAAEGNPAGRPAGGSRAWHVLPQDLMIGDRLLEGLHRQLASFAAADERTGRVWTGVKDGGQANVDITVAQDVQGEMLVGFFSKPTWDAPPVQVRAFSRPGQYVIKGLPPGKWQVGAIGSCASGRSAGGVCSNWPSPVEIKPQQTAAVRLRVWPDYYHGPKPPPKQLNPENLLQGRVLDPAGRPIAHATVQIRQKREPGMYSIGAASPETDENGRYFYDQMAWPYRVGAIWYEPLPSALGYRHQYVGLNRFFEGPQTVDFRFKPFPTGAATLTGQVVAKEGGPVKRFVLDLRNKVNWTDRTGESIYQFGWRVPFLTHDGKFKLARLPAGTFNVSVHPFQADRKTYNSAAREVTLKADQATRVDVVILRLPVKAEYYGRVLFEDGTAAFLDPPPWKGAQVYVTVGGEHAVVGRNGHFALPLSDEVLARLKAGTAQLEILCPVPDAERTSVNVGTFPADLLSTDRDKAGTVKVPAAKPWMQPLPAHVGRTAADFELPGADGQTHKLSAYKGKVVLLNIFATWCGPCMEEMPHLAEAQKKYADKGLVILAVSRREEPAVVKEFARRKSLPFPVLIDPEGKAIRQFADKDGTISIPRSLLLDRAGRAVFASVGFTRMGFARTIRAIERALQAPAPAAPPPTPPSTKAP